ncbi:hypothetical protein [Streptomyces sp. STR69]|uniref:hypothetical protein n=1 Tax=Streptomyces sp. STR69 TaxID=1796942 RepID=UPI0021C63CFE|nr:hypothetical protein [Streptomyces sp. STR69]
MQLTVAFDEDEVAALQKALREVAHAPAYTELGLEENTEGLARRFGEVVAKAGANEVFDQVTDRLVPFALTEYRQLRVYGLLCNGMSVLEAEIWISAIFKITTASATSLLRATFARFYADPRLDENLRNAAQAALLRYKYQTFKEHDLSVERRIVTIASRLVSEWVTDVARLAGRPSPRRTGNASQWRFSTQTHDYLLGILDVSDEDRVEAEREARE